MVVKKRKSERLKVDTTSPRRKRETRYQPFEVTIVISKGGVA